jgi:hypothetical protein
VDLNAFLLQVCECLVSIVSMGENEWMRWVESHIYTMKKCRRGCKKGCAQDTGKFSSDLHEQENIVQQILIQEFNVCLLTTW